MFLNVLECMKQHPSKMSSFIILKLRLKFVGNYVGETYVQVRLKQNHVQSYEKIMFNRRVLYNALIFIIIALIRHFLFVILYNVRGSLKMYIIYGCLYVWTKYMIISYCASNQFTYTKFYTLGTIFIDN